MHHSQQAARSFVRGLEIRLNVMCCKRQISIPYNRRETLTKDLFNKIVQDSFHKLHALLPEINQTIYRKFEEEIHV